MASRFDDSFFGGTVCGSWLALGGVAALGLATTAIKGRKGSGAKRWITTVEFNVDRHHLYGPFTARVQTPIGPNESGEDVPWRVFRRGGPDEALADGYVRYRGTAHFARDVAEAARTALVKHSEQAGRRVWGDLWSGSRAIDLDAIVAGVVGGHWTRGQVYGELKRLLRENKLRVTAARIGTGKNFYIGLFGPDADLVARSLERGGLRVGGGEPILLTRTAMSGDGSDRINPITLDFR